MTELLEILSRKWQYPVIFWTFCIVKALLNGLRHDYPTWKKRLHIPDEWDWYFDPGTSHRNKYFNWVFKILGKDENKWKWLGKVLTPFSDFWHSLWTFWQIQVVIIVSIKTGSWLYGVGITGIVGVYIIFNGIYAYVRNRQWIKIP